MFTPVCHHKFQLVFCSLFDERKSFAAALRKTFNPFREFVEPSLPEASLGVSSIHHRAEALPRVMKCELGAALRFVIKSGRETRCYAKRLWTVFRRSQPSASNYNCQFNKKKKNLTLNFNTSCSTGNSEANLARGRYPPDELRLTFIPHMLHFRSQAGQKNSCPLTLFIFNLCTLLSEQPPLLSRLRKPRDNKYDLRAEASFLMETFAGLHLFQRSRFCGMIYCLRGRRCPGIC